MWVTLGSIALEVASWPGRDHQMKPKRTPDKRPSSPVEQRSVCVSAEERGSSEQRAMCGSRSKLGWFQVSMGKHGSALRGEEVVTISPVSGEDALTVEGWFCRKV